MSFLRGFSLNAASTALAFALGWANHWLLANHLDKAGYGRLALWTTTAVIAATLLGEWLRRGTTFVVGREGAGAEARDNALLCCLVILGVGMGLAYAGAGTAGRFLGPEALSWWPLLAALPALVVLQRAGQAVLLGMDRIRPYAAIPVLFISAYLGSNAVLLMAGRLRLELALVVFAGAAGVAGLAAFLALRRAGPSTWGDRQLLRRTLAVGWRGALSVSLVLLLLRGDFFLIKHFLDEASVGTYRVALNFAEMMQCVPDVAGAVLLAKVVRGEDGGLSLRVARGTLLFSLAAALALLAAGRPLIGWLFSSYPEAFPPLAWMLPGLVFLGLGSVCNTRLAGEGYPAITLWAAAVALGLNLGLGLWLIPGWGLLGAAWSKSIAYAAWALLVCGRYLRMEDRGWGALFR
ncbi:MAG: polysaccharide biosynthesis C-terminal domain-containing protein [Gemmatimonadaceae bacterium]|nr:polysaccharide biosynthesis C-terminal domain-containing protein [Gemmatimonadaceae bacterium]